MTKKYAAFFEKFPKIILDDEQLVWDTRQVVAAGVVTKKYKYPEEQSLLAAASSLALGEPSKKLRIWGVTGTNGKSSTVEILRHLLCANGRSVLQLGTLGLSVWDPAAPAKPIHSEEVGFTTPLAPQLQWILKRAVDEQIQEVVMEVSSHALSEGRSDAIDFDCAIFTNLTRDHLDFHKTMENYFEAKARFFTELLAQSSKAQKVGVINIGVPYGRELFASVEKKSFASVSFDFAKDVLIQKNSVQGLEFNLSGVGLVKTSLIGDHNVENTSLALLAVAKLLGQPVEALLAVMSSFPGVRGRLERVLGVSKTVFVDYAHTPDALEKVLRALQKVKEPASKLWVVFGCGGDRDAGKRPIMGKIAEDIADSVVLTSDNPRTEDPSLILAQIQSGLPANSSKLKIVEVDRRQAIAKTLDLMDRIDVCVIAGKGHEDYQIIGTQKSHFSDVETVKALLKF